MHTVLVVDDGKVDQRLAGRLLKDQLEISVRYADNGRQALESIQQRLPDILVTDMKMVRFLKQKASEDKKLKSFLKKMYMSLFGKD